MDQRGRKDVICGWPVSDLGHDAMLYEPCVIESKWKKKLAQCNLAKDMGQTLSWMLLLLSGHFGFYYIFGGIQITDAQMRNLYIVAVEPPKIANIVST